MIDSEVIMHGWIARYEEGYITVDGESVTLTDEFHQDQPWHSPAEAREHWAGRKDLASPGVQAVGNGLQQTDDVRARSEFSTLGVVAVWRRVTFRAESAAQDVRGV